MRHTLLVVLLGASVSLAIPSLSFANNGYSFKGSADDVSKQYQQKLHANNNRHQHKNAHKKFVKKSSKPHYVKKNSQRNIHKSWHHNRQVAKHGHNKHYSKNHNKRHSKHHGKPSFSFSWNAGGSTASYGNDGYHHGYGSYDKHREKNHGKRIYQRMHKQANRIQHGINKGQLVRREVRRLRHEQRHIKRTLSHYKRDGRLDGYERSQLKQLLNAASDNIYRKSNNRITRYSRQQSHYAQY